MKFIQPNNKESGVVSILSVMFFIILMSIMAVSFLRIVTDQQQQVIEDDLGKGALAAAQSGVEDAKRALLYCRTLSGTTRDECFAALKNQQCPGIFASNLIVNGLSLTANQQGDGSMKVGDPNPANNNNERYTCVTLTQDTKDYEGILSTGLGQFIPLRANSGFNQIRISWHKYDPIAGVGEDGPATIPSAGGPIVSDNLNPRKPQWQGGSPTRPYIAMPRVQLMEFDPGQTLAAQENNTTGTFLIPTDGASAIVPVTAMNSSGIDKRQPVGCDSPQDGYLCTATLDLSGRIQAGRQYFMLLKSQYATPHYKVELLQDGLPATFDDVQPEVDSTGVAGNVYKRVISRIEYQADTFFTSFAIESGLSVCKNFFVTIDQFNNDACVSVLPPGAVPPSMSGTAGIGGYCAIHVCTPGDDGGEIAWTEEIVNLSMNDPSNVLSCTWDFGDGSPLYHGHCNFRDSFHHTYPEDPAYLTNPNLPKIDYTVTLTVNLRSGGTSTANYTFHLPEHYP